MKNALILLKKLRDENIAEYYYTPFNLFEIMSKLSKLEYDSNRGGHWPDGYRRRIQDHPANPKRILKSTSPARVKGHQDLIDLLPYTTSQNTNLMLLTRDYTLIEFLGKNHEDTSKILDEKKFIKLSNGLI